MFSLFILIDWNILNGEEPVSVTIVVFGVNSNDKYFEK